MALYHKVGQDYDPASSENRELEMDNENNLSKACCLWARWQKYAPSVGNLLLVVTIALLLFDIHLSLRGRTFNDWMSADHSASRWNVRKSYGHDRRYMSLDHKYDSLWEVPQLGEGNKFVLAPPYDSAGNSISGVRGGLGM